jgi:uncharacterized repeat protein (TIGR01451 family)/LPXTG-motif cell wall-anchored protein
MGKLINALRRLPKRTSAMVAIAAAAIIVPATLFAWGPGRPTYTIEQPADHVTFNSITNNPEYGDERSFLTVRDLTTGQQLSGSTDVVDGHEYLFQVYVHNNAASNLNSAANGYKGIAKGTTLEAAIPSEVNGTAEAAAYVSASNATPNKVWDTVALKSAGKVGFDYQEGTARLFTNHYKTGQALSDNVMTAGGVKVGYDNLNGDWPGCMNYSGTVTFRVKAYNKAPDFTIQKQVRKANDSTSKFGENVEAAPGTKLNYRLSFTNTGKTDLKNVVLKDKLPQGISYVPGSVMILNASHPGGAYIQNGDKLFTTGVGIGNYTASSNALVIFDATVGQNDTLPKCGVNTLKNIASAQPEGQNPKEDGADVTVPKECQQECKYACEGLTVDKIDRTKFKFTVTTSEQNATFKKVTYVIRNEQGTEIERKESTSKTLEYTRTQVGKYTVEALVTFTVNGAEKTVTATKCKKPFEVTEEPVTPVYRCDSLTATKIERTKFKFDTKYTAEHATLKSIVYVIRDGNGTEIARQTSADYTQTTPGNYSVEAIVTVTVDGQDKVAPGNCKAQFEVVKESTPGVKVDKKVDGVEHKQVGVDQEFTYQIRVTNTGEVDLKDTVVTDAAPQGVIFLAASAGSIKDNAWTYTIAELKVGQSTDFTITAKVPAYLAGKIVNTVCVESPQVPGNPDDCDDATVEVPPTPCVPGKDKECTPEVPEIPETPKELPKTGASEGIIALIGAGSLIASIGYYIASRRSLIG